jgi:chromosomal replication initiator protein
MRGSQKISIFRPLNPEKIFASFVSNQNNQDAYDLCKSVASNAGNSLNPLIICGGDGFGKTHLLHAIGNHCIEKSSKCRVKYATLFDFTNEMMESYKKKRIRKFWFQFQNTNMLLLDDIEKDESKPRLLAYLTEELTRCFAAQKKQIVCAVGNDPTKAYLSNNLLLKFEGGIKISLYPPDTNTKIKIINKNARQQGVYLCHALATVLAKHAISIRELDGLLIQLKAHTLFQSQYLPTFYNQSQ